MLGENWSNLGWVEIGSTRCQRKSPTLITGMISGYGRITMA
jgi:hypothetical protein